jgi:tetratricopeptide (TPR) repeat protein
MSSNFQLAISANSKNLAADLTLKDRFGVQVAQRTVEFGRDPLRRCHDQLFDTRNWLRRLYPTSEHQGKLKEIGVVIARDIFGSEIFDALWKSRGPRTLRIVFEGADPAGNLAAALARAPWEIARQSPEADSLAETNLRLCIGDEAKRATTDPLPLVAGEPLRILFVFATVRSSRPLAARRERWQLRSLFETKIFRDHNVIVDFLTHGVTRERLIEQVQTRGGYHILHWSGHGHQNLLELVKADGELDKLSGEKLLELLHDAGGYVPRLAFLSACHSGAVAATDMESLLRAARGGDGYEKEVSPEEADALVHKPGFTGTAHALLAGGVPTVVAMRFSVGDAYARDLAIEFYDGLLGDRAPKDAAGALTQARKALLAPGADQRLYSPCDHATPILYGETQPGVAPPEGESAEFDPRGNRRHRIAELDARTHAHFVGRTWELAALEREFFGIDAQARTKPVAAIVGIGGMGKTALAAEALDLWGRPFKHVLLYQAKPNELRIEDWLRDIDLKLREEQGWYFRHVQRHTGDAVFLPPRDDFKGEHRYERLVRNLVQALKDEAILILLDNFETNLKEHPQPGGGEPAYACKDKAWDDCLARLSHELAETPSRVLITCRRPLAALAGTAHLARLGPLPPGEAALFLADHKELQRLVSAGEKERKLAQRIGNASRFHPLLMDRLARLAAPEFAEQLEQALATLEKREDFSSLPALFATKSGDAKEIAYLEDALATSLDQLIADVSADARRLMWMVATANEPVAFTLLAGAWSGESLENEQLREVKTLLDNISMLPPQTKEMLKQMPPALRAAIEALPPAPQRPDPRLLLRQLTAVGLVDEWRDAAEDENTEFSCHELARERIRCWMAEHKQDQGGWSENTVRLAYGERLAHVSNGLLHKNMSTALEAGARAVVYFVQAGAYERMGRLAGTVVTSAKDPKFLERLLPHLEAAAHAAPEGEARWTCLVNLADALRNANRPDQSLEYYQQGADLARISAAAGGDAARQARSDLAWILDNWSNALVVTGNLSAARQKRVEAAEANRQAGLPLVSVITDELEVLRIDVEQGQADAALPQIEERLSKIEGWWTASRAGSPTPDAPNREALARTIMSALDTARQANYALQQWEAALKRIDAVIEIKRELKRSLEDIAGDRMNRAVTLIRLHRESEAKLELEACLDIFENDPSKRAAVLGSLSNLYYQIGDLAQAITQARRALTLRNTLPEPGERARSHEYLAVFLCEPGEKQNLAESARHGLANLAYLLVTGLAQPLETVRNYVIDFRAAASVATELNIPRLAELLDDPAFVALKEWLVQRQVDLQDLQAIIDEFLDRARQATKQSPAQ